MFHIKDRLATPEDLAALGRDLVRATARLWERSRKEITQEPAARRRGRAVHGGAAAKAEAVAGAGAAAAASGGIPLLIIMIITINISIMITQMIIVMIMITMIMMTIMIIGFPSE